MPFEPGQSGNPEAQFKPGQSGNPAGYSPGVPNRSTLIKRLLALEYEIDDPINEGQRLKVTVEEAVQWGVIQKAVSGDVPAYKEIMDTMYGKQTEKKEIILPARTIIRIGEKRPKPEAPVPSAATDPAPDDARPADD